MNVEEKEAKKYDKFFSEKVIPLLTQLGVSPDRPEAKNVLRDQMGQLGRGSLFVAAAQIIPIIFFFLMFGMLGIIWGLIAASPFVWVMIKYGKKAFSLLMGKKEVEYYERKLDMIRAGELGTDGQPTS
ncbi:MULTISPECIES: hypothetical protein [unclassified Thioalkalivibrio]|uniref:hypothetical protein n=1 Tax=unclassified Thioalkalivibrio TaxID=2621013 RepID=UPI0003818812|nr:MULTISPECIES: hypothetical protein [unclassified Thioalkalivibrio]